MDMLKYTPYLKEFDYPNITYFNDEQILDIFSAENRSFLLTWLAKNLNSKFIVPTEWTESSKIAFADFFYEKGFCTSSQKLPFVRGDENLPIEKKVEIFDRIFQFLKDTSRKENPEPPQNVSVSPKETVNASPNIELLLKKDINLFPMFGPLKLRSDQEKQQKMNYYKEEIQQLKNNISSCNCNEINSELSIASEINEGKIENIIEKFKTLSSKLQDASTVFNEDKQGVDERVSFKPDIENKITECIFGIKSILQYFKMVNLSHLIDIKELEDHQSTEEHQTNETIKQQVQTAKEILKIITTSND